MSYTRLYDKNREKSQKEGKILVTQVLDFLTAQTDKLMLAGIALLVIFSALQLNKMSRINRQLICFGEKLTGYLQAVLAEEDTDEEPEEAVTEDEEEFVSKQEQNMRDALEQQKQQKKIKDAQIFDAVLSEIFP